MKWGRRFRARLKAALRAALGAYRGEASWADGLADDPGYEVLTVKIAATKGLLNECPSRKRPGLIAQMGNDARRTAEAATRDRLARAA